MEPQVQPATAGELVRELCVAGMTVEQIAVAVGVSSAAIWRWKRDAQRPHRAFRKALEQLVAKVARGRRAAA